MAVGWEGGLPLRRLAAVATPNLEHISRQLQQRYRLSRGRTWLEFVQVRHHCRIVIATTPPDTYG